jgi:hypothetical protein
MELPDLSRFLLPVALTIAGTGFVVGLLLGLAL